MRAYDGVVTELASCPLRIVIPYLRGFGPTRYRSPDTLRSGQQGALAADLLAFMDALAIERATLGGYDWGGRAACIVAALHPRRVGGLVTCGGYNLQNIPQAHVPQAPAAERAIWYQYYLHGERGRTALLERREELCRFLWRTWSPQWQFGDADFARSAPSLHNADFVETVVHSYRHRFGLVAGDPAYAAIERALESQPRIEVPTISLEGAASGLTAGKPQSEPGERFGVFQERSLAGVGHNVPQEAPLEFARAVRSLTDT